MKTQFLLLPLSIIIATSVIADEALDSNAFYRRGVAAEQAGDPDAARAAYEEALRLNPRNADARYSLGQLRQRRDVIARKGREAALAGVMLPRVQLSEASFRESLDALARMVETQSEEKVTPNFVIQDPDGKFTDAKISMELRNVPASAVLEYLLGQVGARARHDEFAIVIIAQ